MPDPRVRPMGALAVLVECDEPAAWARACSAARLAGVVDIVPAAETVLLTFATSAECRAARDRIPTITSAREAGAPPAVLSVDVRYDGPDLAAVAASAGLGPDDVVRLHSEASYAVAFCGFSPGFGYLSGLPPQLHLPRRDTPRTRVPVGSVAIAAEFSAIYPGVSPGGWHLIGTTDLVIWDPTRNPPALLQPGTPVRFKVR